MLWALATGDILVLSLGQPSGMAWDGSRPAFFIQNLLHIWTKFYNLSLSAFSLQAGNLFLICLLDPLVLVLYMGKKSVCKLCVITGLTTVMW